MPHGTSLNETETTTAMAMEGPALNPRTESPPMQNCKAFAASVQGKAAASGKWQGCEPARG
eukprot:5157872-Alexandrium_andersonii.AAC.1